MPQKPNRGLVERFRILHLMKQFANPTICHRRNGHTRFFAVCTQPRRHVTPIGIVTNQSMCRFDQDNTEQLITGLDEAACRYAGTPAKQYLPALELLRGHTAQKCASCLPVRNRSKRPINARIVMAQCHQRNNAAIPMPGCCKSCLTTESSITSACIFSVTLLTFLSKWSMVSK